MARQEIITYIDDVTGQPGDDVVPVVFGANDWVWTIDLSQASQKQLAEALAPFVDNATRLGRIPTSAKAGAGTPARTLLSGPKPKAKVDKEQTQAIRDWARRQGLTVSDRGRISARIMEQYLAAH